jgi:hypothetical protein
MAAPATALVVTIGIILLILLGLSLYYRNYLRETFNDGSGSRVNALLTETSPPPPYATTPIYSVDDYEYNLIFNQESDRPLTESTRNILMSQYPMDWVNQPPSSVHFQQGMAAVKESFLNPPPPQVGNPYASVDGSNMIPPDTETAEKKEREILQTYVPNGANTSTYDLVDAKQLIDKIYTTKGKKAEVRQVKENVFEVYQVRDTNEKIVYEDELPASQGAPASSVPVVSAGEATILVPPAAQERVSGLDPFFSTDGTRIRQGKWDYTRWTPGLERAFAPSEPMTHWY